MKILSGAPRIHQDARSMVSICVAMRTYVFCMYHYITCLNSQAAQCAES